MPARQPVVVTDGTTSRTLNPQRQVTGGTDYRTNDASIRGGEMRLHFEQRDIKSGQRLYARLAQPLLETSADTGLTTVVEEMTFEANIRIPDTATDAERARFIAQAFSVADAACLKVEIETGEGQW